MFPPSTMMEVRLLRNVKANSSMKVTERGIVTDVRPQSLKALIPMLVTVLGMVTEVRPEQP